MSYLKNVKVAGAAAAALTIAAVASPTLAAGSTVTASATYACHIGLVGADASPVASYVFAAPPATLAAGQKVALASDAASASVTIDTFTNAVVAGLGWKSFSGTIKTTPTNTKAGLDLTIPKTALTPPNNADPTQSTTTSSAPLAKNLLLRYTTVGTKTLTLGNLGAVHLQGYDAAGDPLGGATGSADFPSTSNGRCTDKATSTVLKTSVPANATVKVVKDTTKAAVTAASYSKAKKKTTASAKVTSHFGLKPTGSVKFVLKKGTTTVKSFMATVNSKGVAKGVLAKTLKKGKYSVTAKYLGNANLKASATSAKKTFSVS